MRRAGLLVLFVLLVVGVAGGPGEAKLGVNTDLDVVMVNVPAGDCFVLELPGKKDPVTLVVDGGESAGGYRVSQLLNPNEFVAGEGAKAQKKPYTPKPVYVDAVVATHVHDDHMSGLTKMMNLGYVRPRAVYWNNYPPRAGDGSQGVYTSFKAACGKLGLTPAALSTKTTLGLALDTKVGLRILNPDPSVTLTGAWGTRTNNASVVLDIAWDPAQGRHFGAILCGDMYQDAQCRVLASTDRPMQAAYDLVKLAHHGSAHQHEPFVSRLKGAVVFTTPGPDGYGTLWHETGDHYFPTTTCLDWLGISGLVRPQHPDDDLAWQKKASSALSAARVYCAADPRLGSTNVFATATNSRLTIYHFPGGTYRTLTWRALGPHIP